MSKPIFTDSFSLDTRRNRKSFILFYVLAIIAFIILGTLSRAVYIESPSARFIVLGIFGLAFIALNIVSVCYSFQRCNDIAISRLWAIATYIAPYSFLNMAYTLDNSDSPSYDSSLYGIQDSIAQTIDTLYAVALIFGLGIGLYLIFKKGQEGLNRFGPNPLEVEWKKDEITKGKKAKKERKVKAKRKRGKNV